jgi:transcriptional regulator with XRE-family HTH domain
MAEDLWKLRKRRGMSISQLASKAGVPALSIQEYEQGHPVRVADLGRLAKALFVDEFEIKIQSDPKPAGKPAASPAPEEKPTAPPPKKTAPAPPPSPAKPTQISHLMELARKLGQDEADVQAAAQETEGKPLDQLSLTEARQLLHIYTEKIKEQKTVAEIQRPDGTRRKRAHLPEGVDEFELKYLESCRESGDMLTFHLLNGKTFTGRVIGFSPYQIMITQDDGTEITLHKLALAYYLRPAPEKTDEEATT